MPNPPKLNPELPVPNIRGADRLAAASLLEDEATPIGMTEIAAAASAPESPAPASDDDKEDKAPPPSTPAERWRQAIAAADMDEDKANRILDAFVAPGFYHEELSLMGGRIRVTLRTREAENRNRVMRALDRLANPSLPSIQETTMQYNLAGSLWKFWKRGMKEPVVLPFPTRASSEKDAAEMFDKRMDFLLNPENIGAPVLDVLFEALARFDRRVWAALSEGAAQGF